MDGIFQLRTLRCGPDWIDRKSGQRSERGSATTGSAGRKKMTLRVEQVLQVRQIVIMMKPKQKDGQCLFNLYSPRHRSDSVERVCYLIIVAVLINKDIGYQTHCIRSYHRVQLLVQSMQTFDDKLGLRGTGFVALRYYVGVVHKNFTLSIGRPFQLHAKCSQPFCSLDPRLAQSRTWQGSFSAPSRKLTVKMFRCFRQPHIWGVS